eukprot:357270-Chlamydomonas_euryale.AAC.18
MCNLPVFVLRRARCGVLRGNLVNSHALMQLVRGWPCGSWKGRSVHNVVAASGVYRSLALASLNPCPNQGDGTLGAWEPSSGIPEPTPRPGRW